MKSNLFLTLALLTCMTMVLTSFTTLSDVDAVTFSETTHQFNKIPQGTPVSTMFKFTNNSDKALIIKSVKASCGCTAPSSPKAPIMSGETSEIKVTYNAANAGKFKKSVTVNTNLSETPIVLYIEGDVIAKAK